MAIELTPEEEVQILRQRLADAQRMNAQTNGQRAGAEMQARGMVSPPVSPPASPTLANTGITWGGVVKGVKAIVKYAVIAVVLTAAFVFATGFLTAAAAYSPAFASVIGPVLPYMQGAVAGIYNFLGAAGTYLSGFSLGSAAAGAGTSVGTAAAAAAIGGTALIAGNKAAMHHVATGAMPMDSSAGIDPAAMGALASKKNVIASQAAQTQPAPVDNTTLMALPDSPHELQAASQTLQNTAANNAQAHAAHANHSTLNNIKAATHIAHDAVEETLATRRGALARLQQAQAELAQKSWVERVAPAPASADLSRS